MGWRDLVPALLVLAGISLTGCASQYRLQVRPNGDIVNGGSDLLIDVLPVYSGMDEELGSITSDQWFSVRSDSARMKYKGQYFELQCRNQHQSGPQIQFFSKPKALAASTWDEATRRLSFPLEDGSGQPLIKVIVFADYQNRGSQVQHSNERCVIEKQKLDADSDGLGFIEVCADFIKYS